ncbi:MAG: hypothetical protein RR177_06605, partial [Oscillospiraceae bacterium]
MNKTLLICKSYYMNWLGINKAIHSKDRRDRHKLVWLLIGMVALGLLILSASFGYSLMFGFFFKSIDKTEALISCMLTVSSLMCLITTVYKGSSILFSSNDFDIIMPLPIKPTDLIAAKLIALYGMNLGFTLIVMLPASLIYCAFASASLFTYIVAVLMVFLVPVIPIVLGTVISVFVQVFSARFRSKNIISIILSLVFFGGIMVLSFSMGTISDDEVAFANLGNTIASTLQNVYPLCTLYNSAALFLNPLSLIAFIGLSAGLGCGFCFFIAKKFKAIHTFLSSTKVSKSNKARTIKSANVGKALFMREIKRYLASSIYVVNTIFGSLLLVIGAIALPFVGEEVKATLMDTPMLATILKSGIPMVITIMVGMVNTCAVSISMEGKTIGIIKTLPITTMDIFKSKLQVNAAVCVPAILLAAIILNIVFWQGPLTLAMSVVLPIAYNIL